MEDILKQILTEIQSVKAELKSDMQELRQEMNERLNKLEQKLDAVRAQTAYNSEQEFRLKAVELE